MAARQRRGAGPSRWIQTVAGALLLSVAAAAVAYPLWWDHRSSTVGHALLERGLDAGAGARGHTTTPPAGRCAAQPANDAPVATTARPGVLDVPSIGLMAPVVNGVGTSVLDVAVGHDPSTVWPGSPGESVLLAHDVSYFSGLSRLRPGDSVIWKLGCTELDFRVRATAVTTPGAGIPVPPSGSGLALVTCWPTNALFWTSQRFVVETTLEAARPLPSPVTDREPPLVNLRVPAPPALAAEGLALGQSGVFVGTLAITGSPSASFSEGPQPLAIEGAALEDYAAAAKTAAAGDQSWWSAIAVPGVALPPAWSISYTTDVTLVVTGTAAERVVLTSPSATVTLTVRGGELLVTQVVRGT